MEHLEAEHLIIRADASTEIGTGHLMRCLALAQAWKDAGGKVTFVTACQNQSLLRRLRAEGFDIHVLAQPYPDPADWEYTKNVLSTYPGAWVVLDGYHFDEVYQQWVKEAGHQLFVIDDMVHFRYYYADIVFNQNLHAEQLYYPCEPYTRLLLGTRYALLRREFLAWRDWQREIPEVARRVLVTLGGGDPENVTLKVIQALQKLEIPGLEATIVIGATNPHTDALEAAASQSRVPLRLVHNIQNMPELMAWADVAVSGGGATCWELEYIGVPTLVVALAPNQEGNARAFQEKGIALTLNREHAHDSEKMSQLIQELLDNKQARTAMSRMGRGIVDGFGAFRVLATIMAYSPISASNN